MAAISKLLKNASKFSLDKKMSHKNVQIIHDSQKS
jgi:hypothetical protein